MDDFSYYTFSNRHFFDTLDSYPIQDDHSTILRELIPDSWELQRFEHWLQASHPDQAPLELQGFKIHVSATSKSAEEILRRVVPICVATDTSFKIVADSVLLRFVNSKRFGRSGSGKFLVVYPPDREAFRQLIESIHQATLGLEGPYILSDKRYRDSKVVFYRYGGFRRLFRLEIDGTRRSLIQAPDGELVEDRRLPYFELPFDIEDPFPEETAEEEEDGVLADRYEVVDAFGYTNTGGVYRAIDRTTGETVVIKEARPYTETWLGREASVDAMSALRKEHAALQKLAGLDCVPQVVDLFKEWEHLFLVTTFFEGDSLADIRAKEDFIVMVHMDDPEHVRSFCEQWRHMALQLLAALAEIHSRGLIVGDVSPTNVLYHRERGEICLIDLEGAFVPAQGDSRDATFSVQWFNPGFRAPDRRENLFLEPIDDYYAAGMLLYSMVIPSQSLYELDPRQPIFRFLDYFVAAGLPNEVREIIASLLAGDVERASAITQEWDIR